MCNRSGSHNPIFCILPPHILRSIAQHGNTQERSDAMQTMSADATFRLLRTEQTALLATRRPISAVSARVAGPHKLRTIYTANNTQTLPGTVVRTEGGPASSDPAVDEAYDGLGATFDFYWDAYQRNSIDDEGLPLNATVHFGTEYDNAFWDGQRMVFGDGDNKLFTRFTKSLDVIGHELTHGVTADEAQLTYSFQPGALNESISDVFGSLVKQYALKQTADKADWLIGADLLASGVKGIALRSMKAPGTAYDDPVLGKDPQPATMANYVNTYDDNGGVHINSGIPNHAFYLVATAIGGNAWEKAGRIWYETLRDSQLRPSTGFQRFANLTLLTASRLYGQTSSERKAVFDAWTQVGIKVK